MRHSAGGSPCIDFHQLQTGSSGSGTLAEKKCSAYLIPYWYANIVFVDVYLIDSTAAKLSQLKSTDSSAGSFVAYTGGGMGVTVALLDLLYDCMHFSLNFQSYAGRREKFKHTTGKANSLTCQVLHDACTTA